MSFIFSFGSYSCNPLTTFEQLVGCAISTIVQPLVFLVVALALLVFLWGIVVYLKNLNSESDRSKGKMMMFWGVVALFVMVSVWGLVGILASTLPLDNDTPPGVRIPIFPTQ